MRCTSLVLVINPVDGGRDPRQQPTTSCLSLRSVTSEGPQERIVQYKWTVGTGALKAGGELKSFLIYLWHNFSVLYSAQNFPSALVMEQVAVGQREEVGNNDPCQSWGRKPTRTSGQVCPLCLESHSFIVYCELLVAFIITVKDGNRERGQQGWSTSSEELYRIQFMIIWTCLWSFLDPGRQSPEMKEKKDNEKDFNASGLNWEAEGAWSKIQTQNKVGAGSRTPLEYCWGTLGQGRNPQMCM